MSKQPEAPVAEEIERQNKEDVKAVRRIAEDASERALQTEKNNVPTHVPPKL